MHVNVLVDAIAPRVNVFLVHEDGRRQGPIGYVTEVCDGQDGHEPFMEQHELTPFRSHVVMLPGWSPEIVIKRERIVRRPSPRDCWDA